MSAYRQRKKRYGTSRFLQPVLFNLFQQFVLGFGRQHFGDRQLDETHHGTEVKRVVTAKGGADEKLKIQAGPKTVPLMDKMLDYDTVMVPALMYRFPEMYLNHHF